MSPNPFGLSLACPELVEGSKPHFESGSRFFGKSGAALSPRRATHFLLLRQEKVSKEKATLLSAEVTKKPGIQGTSTYGI